MGKIIQLDDRLSNMIAAGEVVERPSSVVKELVENAIDAGAKRISISLIDSGIKSISVTDDGCGMSRDDAILAFSRHATSKIKNEYDLFRISTLGFRGEAIPSIASVSRLTLDTSDGDISTRVVYEGGHKEDVALISREKGTTITVENLFYNVPARLKYLKSLPQELSSVSFLLARFILANPTISFTLTNNGTNIYKTLGNGDIRRIFGELYGVEAAKSLLGSSYEGKGYKLTLTLCKSTISRANKLELTTIVNGRYVKSNVINQALIDGYHTYLPESRFPIALVRLEIDPSLIDVNVHPTKLQIRMSNEDEISKIITSEVKALLGKESMIPDAIQKEEKKSYERLNIFDEISSFKLYENVSKLDFKEETKTIDESVFSSHALSKIDDILSGITPKKEEVINIKQSKITLPNLEYIGQLHGTYLVFQSDEGMHLIDQHAAAERINYEYYLKYLSNPESRSIRLLIPEEVELTQSEAIILDSSIGIFKKLGFDLKNEGLSLFVNEIPSWLHDDDINDFIRNTINLINNDIEFKLEKYRDQIAASVACKASIKANHSISHMEVESLIKRLNECENPYTCPHGRPTIIKFKISDLEKMFKRVI